MSPPAVPPVGLVAARHWLWPFLLLWTILAPDAVADPVAAINRARLSACVRSGNLPSLRESPALDAAAARMARGSNLHEVLGRMPERPMSATSMHFAGLVTDSDVVRAATGRFCRELSDASLREIGYARANQDLWIIVTAPLNVPGNSERDAVAEELLADVNIVRAHGHRCGTTDYPQAPALRLSATLSRVARARSGEMASANLLEHEGRDGSTPADRVRRAGYAAGIVGENIADGVPSVREVLTGWLSSAGHCANIMDRRFTEMGVAYATNPRSRGLIYWTQLFSAPR